MRRSLVLNLLLLLVLTSLLVQACSAEPQLAKPKPLSFEAVAYAGQNPDFTIQYPKSWTKKPLPEKGVSVLYASSAPDDRAADTFSVFVSDSVYDIASTLKDSIDKQPAFVENNAAVRITSVTPVMLADGKTDATEVVLTSRVGTYDIWFYCCAFDKDGKTICYAGYTVGGESSKALIKEIARTLKPK